MADPEKNDIVAKIDSSFNREATNNIPYGTPEQLSVATVNRLISENKNFLEQKIKDGLNAEDKDNKIVTESLAQIVRSMSEEDRISVYHLIVSFDKWLVRTTKAITRDQYGKMMLPNANVSSEKTIYTRIANMSRRNSGKRLLSFRVGSGEILSLDIAEAVMLSLSKNDLPICMQAIGISANGLREFGPGMCEKVQLLAHTIQSEQ